MINSLAVSVFGSSSSGNATLVRNGKTALLIDCGFSPRYLLRHLALHGLAVRDLTGILLTHTHADHLNARFLQQAVEEGIPVFCPVDLELHLQSACSALIGASRTGLLKPITRDCVETPDFAIRTFPVPHDSPGGCFGYSVMVAVDGTLRKVSVVTDLAYPTETAVTSCADSSVLVIESNHDVEMLERSRRPVWLKQRIRERGHLSNEQSASLLAGILNASSSVPGSILLAHVSRECNTNKLALEAARSVLDEFDARDAALLETFPFRQSATAYG